MRCLAFVKKRDPRVKARRAQEAEERAQREKVNESRKKERELERKSRAAEVRAARDEAMDEDADALDEILASIALDEAIDANRQRRRRKERFGEEIESQSEESGDTQVDGGNDTADNDEIVSKASDHKASSADHDTTGAGLVRAAWAYSDSDEELHEEEDEDTLYCAACKKKFRTAAQNLNHQKSKKHIAAVKKLRAQLEAEDSNYVANGNAPP